MTTRIALIQTSYRSMDSMMLQYQNPQDNLVDSLTMNGMGIPNINNNNNNNNNSNNANNNNFLNGASPQVMFDDSVARDARKILNYKKSFHDDAVFYPDENTITHHQLNGFDSFRNVTNNNIATHANLLNNILMNKQFQMDNNKSNGQENNKNNSNSNNLLSILANKSLERQQFQFQQQQQQPRRINSSSGNNNNSHNTNNNITANNNNNNNNTNNVYSNYRSQQGDPYLMN